MKSKKQIGYTYGKTDSTSDEYSIGTERRDRHHVCVTCGCLKHEVLFKKGDCTCEDCYREGDATVRYQAAPDGQGFVLATKQNQETECDCHEAES